MAATFEIQVTALGDVGDRLKRYAEQKVERTAKLAPRPILFAGVTLAQDANPANERPAVAKASLDVSGRLVRAHVAAPTMTEAVDLLEERLQRRLDILSEHVSARRRETGSAEPGEWRHGNLPTDRPPYFPRPADERQVVRHKTYAPVALTPKEAALDMELLDHDFHLFTNADTGREAVVYRHEDGVGLLEDAPRESLEEAIERLDVADGSFVLFVDPATRRGNVLYRRYDGHYGLIAPTGGEA